MTGHLLRPLAPISDSAWTTLDDEARQRLRPALGARKLVDFRGPNGWEHSSTNRGRTEPLAFAPEEGVGGRRRLVLPLTELRVDFTVTRHELRDHDRGALDLDLGSLDDASHRIAVAENKAVFHGWEGAGITGISGASPYGPMSLGAEVESYPSAVAGAVELLLCSGVGGPYGLALGREPYRRVVETAEHGGQLLLDHLRKILDGPIVWAPGVDGAVVVSLRGGDFIYDCGQDLSIGYDRHDEELVYLYIEETLSFLVASPDAAVALAG